MMEVSRRELGFSDAKIPRGMPIITENSIPKKARLKVTGIRSSID